MENAIEIKNLIKNYKDFSLQNITFSVPRGCVMGFIGENGAGKSTTIRSILGLNPINGGAITVLGCDSQKLTPEIKEKIGVVFDELPFSDNLNANQINKILKNLYKSWNSEKYFEYVKKFNLPLKKKIKDFSRGMKMKLSIATALSHNAELLILDEATSGLDPVVRSEILDIFLDFMQDETHSILMSSHITSDLEHIADYVTFIQNGKIVFSDQRDTVLEAHAILKCGENEFKELEKSDIISFRKNRFGYEVLTNHAELYSEIPFDKPVLEDLMVFYSISEQNGKEKQNERSFA